MSYAHRLRVFWDNTKALGLAIAVHLLAAAFIVLGTSDWTPFKPPSLEGIMIEAVMVDTGKIREANAEAKKAQQRQLEQDRRQQELDARRERERVESVEAERLRKLDQAEKKRLEDLRLQQLRLQQEKDRQDQAKRQQEELESVRKQRADAEKQRKLDEERLKQLEKRRQADEQAKRQAEDLAAMQDKVAAEAAEFRAGRLATKQEQYMLAIQSQVTNNWLRPPTAREGLSCTLRIVQIPGGEVISAAIRGKCNGDEATRRSLEAAVQRTGTLPYRGFEDVFEREIDFIFKYDGN